MAYHAIGIAVFLPLLGFLLNGLFGWKIKNERISGIIGSSTVGIAFLIAGTVYYAIRRKVKREYGKNRV